eukprot:1192813-Prorocentrum_minimum.AAC.3
MQGSGRGGNRARGEVGEGSSGVRASSRGGLEGVERGAGLVSGTLPIAFAVNYAGRAPAGGEGQARDKAAVAEAVGGDLVRAVGWVGGKPAGADLLVPVAGDDVAALPRDQDVRDDAAAVTQHQVQPLACPR